MQRLRPALHFLQEDDDAAEELVGLERVVEVVEVSGSLGELALHLLGLGEGEDAEFLVPLVEVLVDLGLHLRELLLDPGVHHLLGLGDGLPHEPIPIVHALHYVGLVVVGSTLLALSCSTTAMAA